MCTLSKVSTASTTDVSIDLGDLGPSFRGWGTSLAWWAHGLGDWPEPTVDHVVELITDPEKGLGLNVFRYNIGGGDRPGLHRMRLWADVPGFKSAADAPWEWNADAAQRRVLTKLVKRNTGQTVVEAFSNSAPWWMTISGSVTGASDGGPNLKPDSERAFADYLADVVEHYRKQGLVFESVEPFNEPDAPWWRAGKDQEGMNVPRDQQARIIQLLRKGLDRRGLRAVRVSATDANSIDDCLTSLRGFDAVTRVALGQVNTHSYFGSKRSQLSRLASEIRKPLWISETGPLNLEGSEYERLMKMAQRLVLDINQLHPEAWCMWQAVSGGPWGCLHDDITHKTVSIGKGFYMYSAFTRHIRPGDHFVNLNSDSVVAAVSIARTELTIVLVNPDDEARTFRLRLLSGKFALPSEVSGVFTNADHDLASLPGIHFEEATIDLEAPAESVARVTASIVPARQSGAFPASAAH